MADLHLPPTPACSFASDNAAGVCPEVMEALAAANAGPALAYGDDPWTAAAVDDLRQLFDAPVEVLFCWGGTGANIAGLATLVQPWQSVITVDTAHIVVDEAGGPARFTGASITAVPHVGGQAGARGRRAVPALAGGRAPPAAPGPDGQPGHRDGHRL